jgi:hypothetical protein
LFIIRANRPLATLQARRASEAKYMTSGGDLFTSSAASAPAHANDRLRTISYTKNKT